MRVILALLACGLVAFGDVLPSDRRITWQPGLSEIPVYSVGITITDPPYNAVGDGITDNTQAIQDAIDACPTNQAIYFPAGVYKTTNYLYISRAIALRGAGPTNSIIRNDGPAMSILTTTPTSLGTNVTILSGYEKGSTNLLVSNAGYFSNRTHAIVSQLNKTGLVQLTGYYASPCSWCGDGTTGERALAQIVPITGVSGSNVFLGRPLYFDLEASLSPAIQWISMTRGVGIEDIGVTMSVSNGFASPNIEFNNMASSWVKNVRSTTPRAAHIQLRNCYGFTVRECWLDRAWENGSGRGYGLYCYQRNSDHLFENNIIYKARHSMIFEGGGSGVVYAYNLAVDVMDDTASWLPGDSVTHGAHPHMNLWEGNVSAKLSWDNTWGSASHNTAYRNHFHGRSTGKTLARWMVDIQNNSYSNSVVACIIGMPGDTGNVAPTNIPTGTELVAYRLGFLDHSTQNASDTNVLATTYRHGNYDYLGASTIYEPSNSDTNFPASMYLAAKPSWFGSIAWPPIGPDVSGITNRIPAQYRYAGEEVPGITSLPADRIIDWDPGVRGGIPSVATVYTNLSATGNDWSQIQTALNNCPSNQVVLLGTGTFVLTNVLTMNRNGVVLRGGGTNTVLEANHNGFSAINVGDNDSHLLDISWTAGKTKGTTNISLASTSGIVVGSVIGLATTNNVRPATTNIPLLVISSYNNSKFESTHCGYFNGTYSMGQLVEVQSISGTNLVIWPPLHMDYTNGNEMCFTFSDFAERVGLESFVIQPAAAAPSYHLIYAQTKNCWLTNVVSRDVEGTHVRISKTLWGSFQGNWLDGALTYGPSAGYGFETYLYTTASLIENNVVSECLFTSQLVTCSGNVIAYNFSTNNLGPNSTNRMTFGHGNHGAHPKMNLYEGNVEDQFFNDYIHGSSSHTTLFRNHFRGWSVRGAGFAQYSMNAVQFAFWNRYGTVYANVLGQEGRTNYGGSDYEHLKSDYFGTSDDYQEPSIYRLGFYNSANFDTDDYGWQGYDDQVKATMLRTNNVCAVNGGSWAIPASELASGETYAASLYLDAKPSWFGSVEWPPIGPDVGGYVTKIPAQYRYNGQEVPGGGGGSPPATGRLRGTTLSITNVVISP